MRHAVMLSVFLILAACGEETNVAARWDEVKAPDAADAADLASSPDVRVDLQPGLDLFEALPELDTGVDLEPDIAEAVEADEFFAADVHDVDIFEAEVGEIVEDSVPDQVPPPFELIPCLNHEDCNQKGICLADEMGGKSCFPWCEKESECPEGYTCRLPVGFEDTACFPAAANLCKPCSTDADCTAKAFPIKGSCLNFGPDGRFCGSECTEDGTLPCPPSHVCGKVAGAELLRCIPKPGTECACQAWMEGLSTLCYGESALGTCEGVRECKGGTLQDCSASAPVIESCDGADNDCNGQVDDGLDADAPTCILDFDSGACQIPKQCLDGKWKCVKIPFLDICTASELECFWWGGIIDTDGDFHPDFCDPDDDGDGFLDEEDCKSLDPKMNPAALELCDGVDGDCNGVGDFDQFGQTPCKAENQWGQCPGVSQCIDGVQKCDAVAPGPDHCPVPEEGCEYFSQPEYLDADKDKIPDICDPDLDGDTIPNELDNCPDHPNVNQFDLDLDGIGDVCDPDDDDDGVDDYVDCCPYVFNPTQKNTDGDLWCDACDPDDDDDTIKDEFDNCPLHSNPDQKNNDKDGKGDACDPDDDDDQVLDGVDNCPWEPNLSQSDADGDQLGDACDPDDDNDLVLDEKDNCPFLYNMMQEDLDKDGIGNACDKDVEGDGVDNDNDNCPLDVNSGQQDADSDGLGDACDPDRDGDGAGNSLDNCPDLPNPDQKDMDKDCPPTPYPFGTECGDVCDSDVDGDGKVNTLDNCPDVYNPDQADLDQDGIGDACTGDKDGDGISDAADNCQKTYNPDQADNDKDLLGDACDADDDDDDVYDGADNCPFVPNPDQKDTDKDGVGDACEN